MTTVGELLAYLDERIPFSWAMDFDRVGLLAGDPGATVERVLVSLDPTHAAVDRATALGAVVLLTHHPAFLDPLGHVTAGPGSGGVVFHAVSHGVALIACHTNLDRAAIGADALPAVLGLDMLGPLEPASLDPLLPRAGRLASGAPDLTVGALAALVGVRLGVRPRVWGDSERSVRLIALAPGSGRSLVPAALVAGADTLVTGELRYHEALEAHAAGLSVIEAGHDATEWPLTRVLAELAKTAPGLDAGSVLLDEATYRWWIA